MEKNCTVRSFIWTLQQMLVGEQRGSDGRKMKHLGDTDVEGDKHNIRMNHDKYCE
jgi:hypothetical protein